jgi:RHS repeat-associated protein
LSGGVSASFQYDGLGRRRAKTISGASTGFLYDGLNTVQELVSGSPSANILSGLGIDEWLTRGDSAGTRHFLTDALGSTLALAYGSGAVQTEYTYEPFGKATASGSSSSNGSQFTGRETDGTGLLYYRARYVDATLQRFISEDPLGFGAGDPNLHAYVFNDPTGLVDPTGEAIMRVPQCDPGNPGSRKFSIPLLPLLKLVFGDPCDPANMMPMPAPLAAGGGPLTGPLRGLGDPLRKLLPGLRRIERLIRRTPGADGAVSQHLKEIVNESTNSITHQVIKDGRVIHQHQIHIGKFGTRRTFPDEWVEFPRIGD